MSHQKNSKYSSEDLKTDSIPDAPRAKEITDEENDSSSLLPPKEEVIGAESESSPTDNPKAYLRPPENPGFGTKTKSSPKSIPRSPKNKKENKKSKGMHHNCLSGKRSIRFTY
jgi:hypothetical protein